MKGQSTQEVSTHDCTNGRHHARRHRCLGGLGVGYVRTFENSDAKAVEPIDLRKDDTSAELVAEEDDDGDGDATRGDDGTSGGNNTGDRDSTRGDDGTGGGDNSYVAPAASGGDSDDGYSTG